MNKGLKRTMLTVVLCSTILTGFQSKGARAFSSNDTESDDTHKIIAEQGLKIVKKDLGTNESDVLRSNLNLLEQNLKTLRLGAIAPDFGQVGIERDYGLFQDHFFNPYTGQNFTHGIIPDTGESQVRTYLNQAVAYWKEGLTEKATYSLGKAIHFLSDTNVPHHASDSLGGPGTAHTKFEDYVESNKYLWEISSLGYDTNSGEYNSTSSRYAYLADFAHEQVVKYAFVSNGLSKYTSLLNSDADWAYAGKESMKNAQTAVASIIYRFLQEVSKTTKLPTPQVIGTFNVVISTGTDTWDGTNNTVSFGMRSSSGKEYKFDCDLPGDDFEPGYTTSYQFNINDENFKPSDITNLWVEKDMLVDDLKVKEVQVYFKGQRVFDSKPNAWVSTSRLNFNVNGLWPYQEK